MNYAYITEAFTLGGAAADAGRKGAQELIEEGIQTGLKNSFKETAQTVIKAGVKKIDIGDIVNTAIKKLDFSKLKGVVGDVGKAGIKNLDEAAANAAKAAGKNLDEAAANAAKAAGKNLDEAAANAAKAAGKNLDEAAANAAKAAGKNLDEAAANAAKAAGKNLDDVAQGLGKQTDDLAQGLGKQTDDAVQKAADKWKGLLKKKGAIDPDDIPLNNKMASEFTEGNIETAIKKMDDLAVEQLDDTASNKLFNIMKKNPGKTIGAAVLLTLGITALSLAADSYLKNNNRKTNIIKSYPKSQTSIQDSLFGTSGDIVIEFKPALEFSQGDKVKILDADFEPNLNGKSIKVKSVEGKNKIVINVPDITKYATTGKLQVKTNMMNRILDKTETVSEKTGEVVGKTTSTVVKTAAPAVLGVGEGILKGFGFSKDAIFITGIVILSIICLFLVVKLFLMFRSPEKSNITDYLNFKKNNMGNEGIGGNVDGFFNLTETSFN